MIAKRLKIGFIVLILLLLPILYNYGPLGEVLHQDNISNIIKSSGMFGPLVFMFIYTISILLFLPATIFTILGGALFGLYLGTLYVVIAATIGGGIGFYISRLNFKDKDFNSKNKIIKELITKIKSYSQNNGFQSILILRLLYLPYMPVSFAAGLIKELTFKNFILATLVTNIVVSFIFVLLGDQLKNGPQALILPVVLIVLSLFIPKIIGILEKKKILRLKKSNGN
ncbi:MAG: VTT domain-containing protein [Candidatus Absconditabacteria bacterium]